MKQDMEQEFLAAYDAYADAIYRHCFFRVFSRTKAEDLMQETFMKFWEYRQRGNAVANIRALLYKIATNLIIDASRKKKEESLDALMEDAKFPEPGYDGHIPIESGAMLREVADAICALPEDEREILTLRYIDDLDPREIAEIVGITANNASVRINRATKTLKEKLGE